MWSNKKTVIYIDRNSIQIGRVSNGKVKNEKILIEAWTVDDLSGIFQKIKKAFGKSVYVIFGDDLSYVLYEKITFKKDELLADVLKQLVMGRVPEDITNLYWYHQILSKNENEVVVQISAFVTAVYEAVTTAINQAGLKITRIEPLSLAIASQVKPSKESILLVYKGYRNLAVVVNQSAVIGSESLNTADPKREIRDLMVFVRKKYDLAVKSVKQKDLHPMIGIVKMSTKNEFFEKNKSKTVAETESIEKEKKPLDKNLMRLILIIILGFLLLALLSFRGWLPEKFNILQPQLEQVEIVQDSEEIQVVPAEITSVTSSPSPSPELVDLSQYSIQILNGSGTAGVATEVEEILAAEGFADFETGNAANYDYLSTEVKLKKDLPNQVFSNIERALNSDYDLDKNSEFLTSDADYDVILIIGKSKETQ